MAYKIQLRRDTTANWELANPVLAAGELGVDLTTGQFKIGDGTALWTELDYYTGNDVDLSGYALTADIPTDINQLNDVDELLLQGGSADTGDITFEGVKVIGAGTASGDGLNAGTIELVPDNSLYENDQYLVVDPTEPNHIHIRAGGTPDASNADLFLGGERNHVRVNDFGGVSLSNDDLSSQGYYFDLNNSDFFRASWSEDEGGNYYIDINLIDFEAGPPYTPVEEINPDWNQFYNLNQFSENKVEFYIEDNEYQLSVINTTTLGNPWDLRIQVDQAPPTNPISLTNISFLIFTLTENYLRLTDAELEARVDGDVSFRAGDDLTLTANDTFALRNYSSEEGIEIITDYDDNEYTWTFRPDGKLEFPDGEVQATGYAGGNGHMMFIDTNRTGDYTANGSADKPFKTFAAAIAAAEDSDATAYTFVLMGCTVTENVDFTNTTFTQITISTTCRSVITGNITVASIPTLSQLVIRNIEVGGTFTLTGDGTSEQMNNCSFYNASFSGAVNITATNATAFYEAAFFSAVNFTNLSYLYINGAQFNADWTITADSDGVIPSRGINPGTGGSIAIVFGTIANNLIFVKGGTAAYVFQPHMTRIGLGAGTYTIPAGWTVTPHSSVLRGTWVNNGTLALRNTSHDNPIGGTAPSYVGIIGAGRVIANLAPGNSKGIAGDRQGMIAVDSTYYYVCTADYTDGVADIWSRNPLASGTW